MTGVDPNLYKELVAKVEELKELARHGYVAVHDRAGQILYRVEVDDLYQEANPFADHGPAEGTVDPSAPLDEDLYKEGATDAGEGPAEGSVDPTAPDDPEEPSRKRRRKEPE